MTQRDEPFVSVVTPVYNGEAFLVECIESVLKQTYQNFEYIIVNNCSKDRTLEIAKAYAQKDRRIRVHDNTEFVAVIANHNIAFRQISPQAKYCKIVSADDWLFPDCIKQLVAVAEANPSVGIAGCYQLSGDRIRWQGLAYPTAVVKGRDMCRRIWLSDPRHTFGFGSPTSLLYRADLVRKNQDFYPNSNPHSDTSACVEHMQHCNYGFAYQVLSYERVHEQTQSHESLLKNRYSAAWINDLIEYGSHYLSPEEHRAALTDALRKYHDYLISNLGKLKRKNLWEYHRKTLEELGHPLTVAQLVGAAIRKTGRGLLNPGIAINKLRGRSYPIR